MRIGAHVSSSGGISKSIARGLAIGCQSLQVFTHNPRTWVPIRHSEDEIAAFRAAAAEVQMAPLVSHGLYLINLGAPDRDQPTGPPGKPAVGMRNFYRASVESLVQHLQIGDALGLAGVVVHVGSFRGDTLEGAIARIGAGIAEALERADGSTCVYLENTAGAGDTVGRTFEQLRDVAAATGHPERLAYCLDTQHLFASGYPVHEPDGIDRVLEEFDRVVGLDRLRCLHLNDSKVAFGSNRDRHENLGDGLIGADGLRSILGCPALQGLPVILEVPGAEGKGPDADNVARAKRLHEEGLALR
ncbi:MAG: deoxyribonuclease [Miltoncostaeaceae bacterium]|nr:deoxyribonuclease [Miltoncostaeaceae bacterium]